MPKCLIHGGKSQCTMGDGGATPRTVLPMNMATKSTSQPIANIMDFKPLLNNPSFGKCMSIMNPVVAAATDKNLGVLQPMPCIPMTTPCTGGSFKAKLKFMPIVTKNSMCTCVWGGQISVQDPGQTDIDVS